MEPAADLARRQGERRNAASPGVAVRDDDYLVVQGVWKTFGSFTALRDVSLTVRTSEFVTFVGPSGCGKTTLVRAIAGLDPATSGRILQADRDITGLPPAQRDFGIVFQSYALFPNLTVAENVGYGLRGAAWPRARRQERVAELIAIVGLGEQAHKYPAQMSGGQQQRVALARALANEPGLLLLDEPLSALDAIVRQHLRTEIRALQRRLGVTTIMVTHDQEEALSVSDRIVVMSNGRIEQIGAPEEIYRRPASAFVATFIGRSTAFDAVAEGGDALQAKGMRILATAASALPPGTPVRAFIRPEDVVVGRRAEGHPAAIAATVATTEFLGSTCRLGLQAGPLLVEADIPSESYRAEISVEEQTLPLLLPPERVLVFRTDV
jgi:iron(III) transport system ATP-binding protein